MLQSKEFENIDKNCLGLKKVQCEVWQDMIFVNLNLEAKSFNGDKGSYVSMLFPNFGITATENMCMYISINPISSTETKIDVYVKSSNDSKKYRR